VLGAGGFGTVWRATDKQLGREVAVKVLVRGQESGAGSRRGNRRGAREAVAAARLSHPGIVALYEAIETEQTLFLVSELVHGATLDVLTAAGELDDRDIVRVGLALCDALAHAHARGVIHRDVKPQNVIVPDEPETGAGVAKLTDFGVAHIAGEEALTRTGDVVGTLAYMAPEQADGDRAGPQADLYSLGLVLYEAFSAVNPVRGHGPADTARRVGLRHRSLAAYRGELPAPLIDAVDAALAPDPARRGSLAQLRESLAGALEEMPSGPGRIAGSPLEGLRPRPEVARPRLPQRLAAGVAAGALAALALADLGPHSAVSPAAAFAATAVVVAVAPVTWAALGAALLGWLLLAHQPGTATVLAVAGLAVIVTLRRRPWTWSVAALAPALGLIGLAGVYPVIAGQGHSALRRGTLGALGLLWLVLAEPLLDRQLLLGPIPGSAAPGTWAGSAGQALSGVLAPVITSGVLLVGAVWALAAVVLPWMVRGRSAARDLLGAGLWSTGVSLATMELAARLPGPLADSAPRGLVLSAAVAALAALGARFVR
jgi:hypothetical protein